MSGNRYRPRMSLEMRQRMAERDAQIAELHAGGLSVRAIAARLGLGKSTVADAIERHRRRM